MKEWDNVGLDLQVVAGSPLWVLGTNWVSLRTVHS